MENEKQTNNKNDEETGMDIYETLCLNIMVV